MNIKTIIIAVVLLLAAALGYYFISSNQTSVPINNEIENTSSEAEDTSSIGQGVGSLMGLLNFGQNVMCTFSYADANTGQTSSGEFYFDGENEKFRVDSITQDEGVVYVSHMINDSEFTYIWSDGEGEDFAMKMPADMDTETTSQDFESTQTREPVSMDQEVKYECNPWRVDNSLFVPPSSVEFMDMASMMQGMFEGVPEGFELPEGFPGQ